MKNYIIALLAFYSIATTTHASDGGVLCKMDFIIPGKADSFVTVFSDFKNYQTQLLKKCETVRGATSYISHKESCIESFYARSYRCINLKDLTLATKKRNCFIENKIDGEARNLEVIVENGHHNFSELVSECLDIPGIQDNTKNSSICISKIINKEFNCQ
ncbi:MAG: hypothetical protein ACOVP4_01980 [Bacteriovoracaceae bacterium]